MSVLQRTWLAVGILIVAGCSSATGIPEAHLVVRSDKIVYSLTADHAATAVLVNLGPAVVYAPMNEYVYVERLVDDRWQDLQPWFAVDGAGISFPIPAGDSLVAFPMDFAYVGRQPGSYRFLFEVAFDSLGRRLVPEGERASPPFVVRP